MSLALKAPACAHNVHTKHSSKRCSGGYSFWSACLGFADWPLAAWTQLAYSLHIGCGYMGRLFIEPLDGKVYSCGCCGSHLARAEDLVSKVRLLPRLDNGPCRNFPTTHGVMLAAMVQPARHAEEFTIC